MELIKSTEVGLGPASGPGLASEVGLGPVSGPGPGKGLGQRRGPWSAKWAWQRRAREPPEPPEPPEDSG